MWCTVGCLPPRVIYSESLRLAALMRRLQSEEDILTSKPKARWVPHGTLLSFVPTYEHSDLERKNISHRFANMHGQMDSGTAHTPFTSSNHLNLSPLFLSEPLLSRQHSGNRRQLHSQTFVAAKHISPIWGASSIDLQTSNCTQERNCCTQLTKGWDVLEQNTAVGV